MSWRLTGLVALGAVMSLPKKEPVQEHSDADPERQPHCTTREPLFVVHCLLSVSSLRRLMFQPKS